jgi:hypothetical protein
MLQTSLLPVGKLSVSLAFETTIMTVKVVKDFQNF